MTFLAMLNDAKARCAVTSADLDSNFRTWLNQAQQNITTRYSWPFLEKEGTVTTASSTETYDLPTDLAFVYMVRDTTNVQKLDFITLREFFLSFPYPTATGVPRFYRLPGYSQSVATTAAVPQVSFYPIPGGTYTLKVLYYRRLSDLVADGDISPIPAEYHELLVNYACSAFFARQGDSRTVTHRDAYESMLLDLVEQYSGQPLDRQDVLHSTDDSILPNRFIRFPSTFGPQNRY